MDDCEQIEVGDNRRQTVLQQLEDLAKEVADDQAAINGQCEDTRKRVVRMGKRLTVLQKTQKVEQKRQAENGEPVQTWKAWCEEQKGVRDSFPHPANVRKYQLIARYPKAYRAEMSIKEAYKEAGKWKKCGGNPPPTEKVTIKARPLITVGAMAGKLNGKIDGLLESDLPAMAKEQQWTEDEILGATDELTLLKQSCNHLLQQLKSIHASM